MKLENNLIFCTIIAKNYMAFAKTLLHSVRLHHPHNPFFILVIDEFDVRDGLDALHEKNTENIFLIKLDRLHIKNKKAFVFKYNITELSTAVKASFLDYLFKTHNPSKIVYFDPDIYVYQAINKITSLLDEHAIILTPHITKSLPNDGFAPDDELILGAGVYNLGFLGVSNHDETFKFLRWWNEKLYDECIVDPSHAKFFDQRVIDFALAMFDKVYILKDPGYNVSYWNLHERILKRNNGVWHCNDGLLYFYHFSGLLIDEMIAISQFQNRYNLLNRPELRPLFEEYVAELKSNGHLHYQTLDYSYGKYNDGKEISKLDRRYYWHLGPKRHEKYSNPFDVDSSKNFRSMMWREAYSIKFREKIKSLIPKLWITHLKSWIRSPTLKNKIF